MNARHWHRPKLGSIALAVVGVVGFIALARWQVQRAHEKEQLFAAFDAAAVSSPVTLDAARREASASRYPRVTLSGRYDPMHYYVLDNQVRDGRAGVMVYDVFEPAEGGAPLLANRGFLARDARSERPPIPPPPAGAQTVSAMYAPLPGSGLHMGGDALPRQTRWPKLTIYLDLAEVAKDLGRALDPRVLLLLPDSGSPFVREWRPEVFPPERHYAYAFTWSMFAAVVVATLVIVHWRRDEVRR